MGSKQEICLHLEKKYNKTNFKIGKSKFVGDVGGECSLLRLIGAKSVTSI